MSSFQLTPNSSVLLLWSSDCNPEDVKKYAEELGKDHQLQLENMERLQMANHENSTFDSALCGVIPPSASHSEQLLAEILRILKPAGKLILSESGDISLILAKLKLTGFLQGQQVEDANRPLFSATKPEYEVGSSAQLKLSFAKKPVNGDAKPAAVWSLDTADMLDDDLELINDDDLLDEDDLKKPDPASLRAACGPGTGKKKACKGCTCGLAEELDGNSSGVKLKTKTVTSACGSCYLGDAFRCSSCPYLGMPAFKSGEKIQLTNRQLNPDK